MNVNTLLEALPETVGVPRLPRLELLNDAANVVDGTPE